MGDYRCEVYCKEFALHETSKTATVHVSKFQLDGYSDTFWLLTFLPNTGLILYLIVLELPQILVQPRSHAAPLGE